MALLAEQLDKEVVEPPLIRTWLARYGPVDMERFETALSELLQQTPTDLHVGYYLEKVREVLR